MTGQEILDLFAQIIGEEGDSPIDSAFAYQLMNIAKNQIEDWTEFEYLKKKWTISGTTLPTDFKTPLKITSYKTIIPFRSFEDYELYSDGYYINYANSTINLVSNTYSPTPILTYIYNTDDLTSSASPAFPTRFHPLLAYQMAFIYQAGIDGDDLNFKMSAIHIQQYELLKKLMLGWDAKLKEKNMGDITEYDPRYSDLGATRLNLPSE